MQSAEETSVLNLKTDYTNLLRDIADKSVELTVVHKQLAQVKQEQISINILNEEVSKKLREDSSVVKENFKNLANAKVLAIEEQNKANELLKQTNKDVRQSVKELCRTNSYVLAAQEELLKVTMDTSNANEALKHLLTLVEKVEQTRLDLADLEDKKGAILGEISTQRDDLWGKIKIATTELETMKVQMVEVKKESDIAQSTLKSYTDQLYTTMNDYQIVISRLEDKWKMSFPELELPLAL